MLSATNPRRLPIERLAAAAPAPEPPLDWTSAIDRTRRFYCDELTPLSYTSVHRELDERHRLRYNQLTGLFSNELIGFLETFVLRRVLGALARGAGRRLPPPLGSVLRTFEAEEARHADLWQRLNRLSEPDWYAAGPYRILALSRPALAAASFAAAHPAAFPLVFWIQLVQEERSIAISRAFARADRGVIEPRYRAVYGSHLRDEVRHVQIDWHLIDHFFAARPAVLRRLNARAFRLIVGGLFLAPGRSTDRIVSLLTGEFPELAPLGGRMRRELRALAASRDYQHMMYSRETTPITFALFDRFPEFHPMRRCFTAYEPRLAGADA